MLLVFSSLFLGCQSHYVSLSQWNAAHSKHHKLVGSIYDTKKQQYITEEALLLNLPDDAIILMGEKHGHPDHHRIQANILRTLSERNSNIQVVTEACTSNQTSALRNAFSKSYFEPSLLPEAYLAQNAARLPIFYALYESNAALTCGDVSRSHLMSTMRGTLEDGPLWAERNLISSVELSPGAITFLGSMIQESHCGALDSAMISPFISMHRFRDASLSLSVQQSNTLLFTGTVHARRDFGIPHYLKQSFPDTPLVSIALLEVDDSKLQAEEYLPESTTDGAPVYDYLIFSPILNTDDPCIRFSQMIHHMKQKYKKKGREDDASRHE